MKKMSYIVVMFGMLTTFCGNVLLGEARIKKAVATVSEGTIPQTAQGFSDALNHRHVPKIVSYRHPGDYHFKNLAPYPVQLILISKSPGVGNALRFDLDKAGSTQANGEPTDQVHINKAEVYPVTTFIIIRPHIDEDFTKNILINNNNWKAKPHNSDGADWDLYDYFVIFGSKSHNNELQVHAGKSEYKYPQAKDIVTNMPSHSGVRKKLLGTEQKTSNVPPAPRKKPTALQQKLAM